MPEMDGLELSQMVKNISPDTPVILTTAFNDEDFFLRSIEIGIDQYLIKPINIKKLHEVLERSILKIEEKLKLELYQKKALKEQTYSATTDAVKLMLDASPNPIAVFQNRNIVFLNDSFAKIFPAKTLKMLISGESALESLLQKDKGCITTYEELVGNLEYKKVSIKLDQWKKFYSIYTKQIPINGIPSVVVNFHDITLQEYQSIKIANYNKYLETLLYEKIYKNRFVKKIEPTVQESSEETALSEKAAILRKKRTLPTTAQQYLNELGSDMNDSVAELNEIIEELKADAYELIETLNRNYLEKITTKLSRASKVISVLVEFEDLSYSLYEIAELLNKNSVDSAKLPKTARYLDGFISEIENWKNTVLVEKSAIDIHYLDASIFSSFLQLEMLLTGQSEHFDDDFTLF